MGLFLKNSKKAFPWKKISSDAEIVAAFESSTLKPVLFFKHSTRCSISTMVLSRLQDKWTIGEESCELYFIDLIANRSVSNLIEKMSGVKHESPQVILIDNKTVIYDASHSNIEARTIEKLFQ